MLNNKEYYIKVPATSANMGPGFDSLGIAFELYNEYIFSEIEEGLVFEGIEDQFANKDNIIFIAMKKVFDHYNYKFKGLKIKIVNQQIPISRGLGSSSSCIVAGIIAAYKIMNIEFNKDDIFKYSVELEGHPDNVCPAIYGGLVSSIMEDNKPIFNTIDIKDGIKFIALIPEFKLSTEKARAILPKEITLKDGVYNVGRASLLVSIFANGNYDLLKYAMKDKFHQEYRGKLIKGYKELTEKSMEIGALSCFLSGAGPTIMTIIKENHYTFKESIEKYMEENNFNYKVVELTIDKKGATFFEVN